MSLDAPRDRRRAEVGVGHVGLGGRQDVADVDAQARDDDLARRGVRGRGRGDEAEDERGGGEEAAHHWTCVALRSMSSAAETTFELIS